MMQILKTYREAAAVPPPQIKRWHLPVGMCMKPAEVFRHLSLSPKCNFAALGLNCSEKRGSSSAPEPLVHREQSRKFFSKRRDICITSECAPINKPS